MCAPKQAPASVYDYHLYLYKIQKREKENNKRCVRPVFSSCLFLHQIIRQIISSLDISHPIVLRSDLTLGEPSGSYI